jgi:hypothetical protein
MANHAEVTQTGGMKSTPQKKRRTAPTAPVKPPRRITARESALARLQLYEVIRHIAELTARGVLL